MRVITQNCVLFLWMYTLTFVESQDCTLEQFLNSRLYDSNFDVTDLETSYVSGEQVRVSCNIGFSGFFKLTCLRGKWGSKGTKCQPRSCGHPGDAQFAEFQLAEGDDFVFGSKVEYTCHKGYQMISRTNYRNCMANGWDGVVPVCEPQNCLALEVDRNVQVNGDLEEATYGNVVRFSCKSNKEILDGPTEIYCDENGEWSGPAPKCKEVTCTVPVIDNGEVLGDIQEYKEYQVLDFVCNANYKPTDERSPKCMKIGTRAEWSPTPLCERISCKLKPPVEGTRYDPAYKNVFLPGDTVTVICGQKYWISNPQETSAEVRCNEDGEWSVSLPCNEVTCRRLYAREQHLTSFSPDDYWKPKITLDDTATYQCKRGYKSTANTNQAVCTRGGWAPDPLCQEITCEPEDISNADLVGPWRRYKDGQQARYACRDGYRGNPTRTCGRNGWTGYSQCTEITCKPENIPNADLVDQKWTYGYNEQAKYVCRDGYRGNPTRTCGRNGWTGYSQCTEITCEPEDIPNAVRVSSDEYYRYGEQARYACKDGFMGNPTRTCGSDGWTGSSQCTEVTCAAPVIDNGEVLGDIQEYKEHQVLDFTCNANYKPTDERSPKCMKIGTRAEWSPTPLCERISCKLKPPVEGTRYDPAYKNVFLPGDTVTVICGQKYWISNPQETSAEVRCNEDGEWSVSLPCNEVTCRRLYAREQHLSSFSLDDYWKQRITLDDTAIYQCKRGYKSTANTNRAVCTRGGWAPDPLCQEITCEPEDIPNADLVGPMRRYRDGQQARYACRDGYRGNPTRTCGRNGWTGYSQCTEITCKPENIPNADLVDQKWTYGYNEQAKYDCWDGYTGNPTRTCGRNGWTGSSECTEKGCEPEDIPNAVRVDRKGRYRYGEQARYACKDGFMGNPTRTCEREGWTGSSECTGKGCEPEDIPNAVRVDPKGRYLYGEQAKYVCKDGFMGNPTRTCEREGWTGSSQCAACPKTEVPNAFVVVRNDSLYYTCNEGYKLITKGWWGEAKCIDGKWSGLGECIEKQNCGEIPLIPNGNMVLQRNVYRQNESISITCEEGYDPETDSLVCLEGQWSSNGIPPETICKLTSKTCPAPPMVQNAVVETSYKKKYLSDSEVIYRCRDGYTMEGENTLRCLDEGWEQKSIKCISPSPEQ